MIDYEKKYQEFLNRYNKALNIINDNQFFIYGAGFAASRFYRCLVDLHCENNVAGFAVTEWKPKQVSLFEKKIVPIESVSRDTFVLIAAHNRTGHEMQDILVNNGFKNFLNVYPYIMEMEYGLPVKINQLVDVNNFINNMLSTFYYPAFIYLAIDSYLNQNELGIDLYKRSTATYTSMQTAEIRWQQFKDKIDIYTKDFALNEDYPIKINLKHNILFDGMHRLMLAKYFKIPQIYADIYDFEKKIYFKAFSAIISTNTHIEEFCNPGEVELVKNTMSQLQS